MKNSKILLVEDDTAIQIYLRKKLEDYEYRLTGVLASGEEAIEAVKNDPPDLVIMDISLEGKMDGIQAASIIRFRYDIPVVYLTANSDAETLIRVKDSDPFGFIVKPIIDKDFYMTIELALFKYHQEKELRKNEFMYSSILNGISLPLVALNERNNVIYMNEAAENWFKTSLSNLRGLNFFEHIDLNEEKIQPGLDNFFRKSNSEYIKARIYLSTSNTEPAYKVLLFSEEA